MSGTTAVPLPRHVFAWLALANAAFTVYGSLVPFHYRPLAWDVAVEQAQKLLQGGIVITSRSDFAANWLLGLPLGFFLMAAIRLDRPVSRFGSIVAAAVVWPATVIFSAGIEFTQLLFPGRICALSDILAQSTGSATGVLIWLLDGPKIVRWIRGIWVSTRVGGTNGRILIAYLGLLSLAQLLPLDFNPSPADLVRKFRDGRVTLVPFGEIMGPKPISIWLKMQTWLELGGLYLLAGMLAAGVPSLQTRGLRRVTLLGFLLVICLELLQLLVRSRYSSTTDIVIGTLAVSLGWMFGRTIATGRGVRGIDLEGALILGQAWMLLLILCSWQPFDFQPGLLERRLARINWMPFADTIEKNYLSSLEEALLKTLLYTPFGAIIAGTGRFSFRTNKQYAAIAIGLTLALLIELMQLMLPARYPGPTDLVFAAAGCWLGAVAVHRLRCVSPEARALEPASDSLARKRDGVS